MNLPKDICHAKLDGTKYVVYDPALNLGTELDDGWIIASYKSDKWISFVPIGIEVKPTHFVKYYRKGK